jgi:phosphatidate cytidylyltransferase
MVSTPAPTPPKPSKRAKLIRRTLWGGSIALVLALALVWAGRSADGLPVALLGGVLGLAGLLELGSMGAVGGLRLRLPLALGGLLSLLFAFSGVPVLLPGEVGSYLGSGGVPSFLASLFVLPALLALALGGPGLARGPRALLAGGLSVWAGLAFASMHVTWLLLGQAAFVVLLVLSKLGDIAGYYVGSAIGRSHPFPGISPGKTTAGCVASLVVALVAAVVAAQAGWLGAERLPWLSGLVFGALVNLAAQAGDLLESVVKRRAGVKDSGTWFGPSGGVLDLVDSLLLTVPVALLTWPLLFAAA